MLEVQELRCRKKTASRSNVETQEQCTTTTTTMYFQNLEICSFEPDTLFDNKGDRSVTPKPPHPCPFPEPKWLRTYWINIINSAAPVVAKMAFLLLYLRKKTCISKSVPDMSSISTSTPDTSTIGKNTQKMLALLALLYSSHLHDCQSSREDDRPSVEEKHVPDTSHKTLRKCSESASTEMRVRVRIVRVGWTK